MPNRTTSSWAVVALCATVVVAEGYDLIVYGALLPRLLTEPGWGLTAAGAGELGSLVYVGMLVGGLLGGRLTDSYGRRSIVLASIGMFTVWTFACALAQSPWQLGLFRLLAGLGMGAVIPSALALAKEYSPEGRTPLTVTILMAGVPLGGTSASLLGLAVLPAYGWRPMFLIGGAISVLILLVAVTRLPESDQFDGARAQRTRLAELFGRRFVLISVLFCLASVLNLLTWYGMNTWLTTLMRELRYPLTSALQFSMTLNIAAVAASFAFAAAARRWGARPMAVLCALLTAAGIFGVALGTSSTLLLLVLIALIGAGAHSALNMVISSVADSYPVRLRGTAIGWANGMGRSGAVLAPALGGWVLSAGLGPRAVFYTFATTALCAAVVVSVLVLAERRQEALV
ncbi:MFS transporter [Actinocrispum sp. NPDC049592]|uniref:MFS transporter n=1 Tax=Actinocrispum sp. NPDC049592 TaxID=3154835 RepID=UPI00344186D3